MSLRPEPSPTGGLVSDGLLGWMMRAGLLGAVLVTFTLAGCQDDPILSPENVEDTGTGGSYGRLTVPKETDGVREAPAATEKTGSDRRENPERF